MMLPELAMRSQAGPLGAATSPLPPPCPWTSCHISLNFPGLLVPHCRGDAQTMGLRCTEQLGRSQAGVPKLLDPTWTYLCVFFRGYHAGVKAILNPGWGVLFTKVESCRYWFARMSHKVPQAEGVRRPESILSWFWELEGRPRWPQGWFIPS